MRKEKYNIQSLELSCSVFHKIREHLWGRRHGCRTSVNLNWHKHQSAACSATFGQKSNLSLIIIHTELWRLWQVLLMHAGFHYIADHSCSLSRMKEAIAVKQDEGLFLGQKVLMPHRGFITEASKSRPVRSAISLVPVADCWALQQQWEKTVQWVEWMSVVYAWVVDSCIMHVYNVCV